MSAYRDAVLLTQDEWALGHAPAELWYSLSNEEQQESIDGYYDRRDHVKGIVIH